MERTLQKYGSYEKFEQATGGSLLTKSRIWNHVRKYMVKEGCLGEVSHMPDQERSIYLDLYFNENGCSWLGQVYTSLG